jgi:hypothetical protein
LRLCLVFDLRAPRAQGEVRPTENGWISAEKRIFPATDIQTSGTRREEKLFSQHEYQKAKKLRGALFALKPIEAMERLLKSLAEYRSLEAIGEGRASGWHSDARRSMSLGDQSRAAGGARLQRVPARREDVLRDREGRPHGSRRPRAVRGRARGSSQGAAFVATLDGGATRKRGKPPTGKQ